MSHAISTECDANGILTLTLDDKSRSMNVLSSEVIDELKSAIERAAADSQIKSILIRSGKTSFVAGADLRELLATFATKPTPAEGVRLSQRMSQVFRRLETLGKPVAVAINGAALGGGFELCLACHYRVLAADPKAVVGLPEVKLGLLPGAGGTQRVPRLLGVAAGLPLLLQGKAITPQQALQLGLVHALAPPEQLIERARAWLATSPAPTQPWDTKGYMLPGGSGASAAQAQTFMLATANVAKETQRNYPAPIAILSTVFEGCQVPIDAGLKIESNYFGSLVADPIPHNMIRTLFIGKGLADKLAYRPKGITPRAVERLGILGAGMMGAGIAYVSAAAEIAVVLLDSTQQVAEKGKAYAERSLANELERGRISPQAASACLDRITPTLDYADLAGCDLVIEAVFEQRDIKADVISKSESSISTSTIVASNTSTLPISGLAASSTRPENFIGIHFFSPVEKMPLVEIIVGKRTSQEAVARALDFVAQIRKTPIVVNDGRGFYTSRVFGTYTAEGMKLLEEGVSPALIENAAIGAGMPVGPLAVSDEVTLELQYKATLQGEQDLGAKFVEPINYRMLRKFVLELKRVGKRSGHGFYEYPTAGKKFLWPGLAELFPRAANQPSVAEVKQRLLYIQALESARCFEQGVIARAADADLGSILGIGFPAYTGGTLSYIDTIGIEKFVTNCAKLAKRHGPRFKPSPWLKERAAKGQAFHQPLTPSPPWSDSRDAHG
jgi:3-hydroxyacyl-CoA dehydrogenase/enoyl-CoA hydratase/3-hydroxybutyryl-CoA epimerase